MRRSLLPAICEAGTCQSTYVLGQDMMIELRVWGADDSMRQVLVEEQTALLHRKRSTDQLCAHKF